MIKVERWHKSDCSWVVMNLATLICWGYFQIFVVDWCLSLVANLLVP